MGILDKIAEIEREIARTQKNKATEYHLGLLKAKLAKYRAELLKPADKAQKGDGFDVMKSGDARVALIGFPSVGKSTLLNALTSAKSECASYEFTTLTCVPGVIEVCSKNCFTSMRLFSMKEQRFSCSIFLVSLKAPLKVCLLHVVEFVCPTLGKGRGRQVIAVARTADVVMMMLDATKPLIQRYAPDLTFDVSLRVFVVMTGLFLLFRELLEKELESVGIRLNQRKPNVYFKVSRILLAMRQITLESDVVCTHCCYSKK